MTGTTRQVGYTSAQTIAVLVGGSVMLTMSMGMRQSWGLFIAPVTQDLGVSVADFTFAIAIQNLVWGVTQPIVGAYADKFGCRMMTVLGTLLYAAGISVTMMATSSAMLIIGLGVMIGVALSCTALALALAAAARAVSAARQSVVLGTISAAGSIGTFIAAPLAQGLIASDGWLMAPSSISAAGFKAWPQAWIRPSTHSKGRRKNTLVLSRVSGSSTTGIRPWRRSGGPGHWM